MTYRTSTKRIFGLALVFLLTAIGVVVNVQAAGENGAILVLYAFGEEGKLLGEKMTNEHTDTLLGRPVLTGSISGKQVVLAEAGMGMANAAMTTQKMLDEFHPKAVLLSGIAGAIDSAVKIGDIVVCAEWIEHDYGYIGKDGFQADSLMVFIPAKNDVVNEKIFHADSAMLALASVIKAESLKLQSVNGRAPRLRVGGVGVTGNQFIDSKEKREWLTKEFHAEITDMESSAVAQVCTVNGVPFVIFRSASDLAGGSGSSTAQVEIEQFFKHAAANSATVVIEYLRKM